MSPSTVRVRGHHWLAIAMALVLPAIGRGEYETIKKLDTSVWDRLFTKRDRVRAVADRITIREKRLTRFLSSGQAFYQDSNELLLLEANLFDENGRVRTVDRLLQTSPKAFDAYQVASVIYHELGHAEWFLFVAPGQGDAKDGMLHDRVMTKIVPWIEKHQTHVDKPLLCAIEWHGYFIGRVIDQSLNDWHDLLYYNGIDPVTMEVVEPQVRVNLERGLVAEGDFGKLVTSVFRKGPDIEQVEYVDRVRGFQFCVSNGSLDGLVDVESRDWNEANGFSDDWWGALWTQVRYHHLMCRNRAQLRSMMNLHYPHVLNRLEQTQLRIKKELAAATTAAGGGGERSTVRILNVPSR